MGERVFMFSRKIDDLGRIVIPKDIRKHLLIQDFDTLHISATDRGILITKEDTCEDSVFVLAQTLYRMCKVGEISESQRSRISELIKVAIGIANEGNRNQ